MKLNRFFRLVVVAAMISMGISNTAYATTLTSPKETTYTGWITGKSGGLNRFKMHVALSKATVECMWSTWEMPVQSHGKDITPGGSLTSLTFAECNNHVTVINRGSLLIHSLGNGNGTVTSSGLELAIQMTGLAITCVYATSNTDLGTLTGSANTEAFTATLDISGATIPRISGSIFCGSSGELTGSYEIETPMTLYVD